MMWNLGTVELLATVSLRPQRKESMLTLLKIALQAQTGKGSSGLSVCLTKPLSP